jgi:hypothetical protein
MTPDLLTLLDHQKPSPAFSDDSINQFVQSLKTLCRADTVFSASLVSSNGSVYFLTKRGAVKTLGVLHNGPLPTGFRGESASVTVAQRSMTLTIGPTSPANAAALRDTLPFLKARTWGLQKSVGCGDRLGLATPGHIKSVLKGRQPDGTCRMAPIFAQQSMRENARTGRTPQQVMDDAMWGVFQEGFRSGFGADADHLKTTDDVDLCLAAGYTFFTVDPGAHVDNEAESLEPQPLRARVDALPWAVLEDTLNDLVNRLARRRIPLDDGGVILTPEEVIRAAAKYGRAVAHTVTMYRHLESHAAGRPFELEMSVDETDTVTSLPEHIYIASELRRLGVRVVSLAPRYVGTFEKGVDYIGDLDQFTASIEQHLAVSRQFGPYKLSLHSGSDKFSVYPIAARVCGGLVHLKTAGTNYLEALRAIARLSPNLFCDILAFACERYPTDRATYHVSAEVAKVPPAASLPDSRLPELLEDFHAREVLHVTFGSVIQDTRFRDQFFETLRAHEDVYTDLIERHFDRHLAAFLS